LFLSRQVERLRLRPARSRIVFPEGDDPRVRAAAARLSEEKLIERLRMLPHYAVGDVVVAVL
jgi:phosphotransacetylase